MSNDLMINDFEGNEIVNKQTGLMQSDAISKISQVQAAVVMAKNFPRDEYKAVERINQACSRKGLASVAIYAYPRGGQTVSGPSIRLAEALIQAWGNCDAGVRELERNNERSICEAYAWDLETNTRISRTFEVPHVRVTKTSRVSLTDPRDIYENVANFSARRLRACILEIIPGDIVEKAVKICNATLLKNDKDEPLIDRVRNMVVVFSKLGITKENIEKKLGHPLEKITTEQFIELGTIYNSIKDNVAKRTDFFDLEEKQQTSTIMEKLQK